MQAPIISLLLCMASAAFGLIAARGFATGRAATRYMVAHRATNPVGFWFAQTFNLLLAATALFGAMIAVRGI